MSELWIVDAFADAPFSGNPAAVCMLPGHRPDSWHHALAAEMNQAETAFLSRKEGDWGLRWFTPQVEVDLCGHATLASAHFLWESGRLQRTTTARFHTRSGILTAESDGDWIVLDFPKTAPSEAPLPAGIAEALGCTPVWTGRTLFDLFGRVGDAEKGDGRGVDFVSRFFAPRVGVPEDPVTGSAHCALSPYWADELGRSVLTGYQASARGGMVRVETRGDRVLLGGKARTVVRGELVG